MAARVVGFLSVVLLLGQVAQAAPRWARVSYPSDPAHEMYISWNTDSAAASQVEYGTTSSYGMNASGASDDLGGDVDVVHTVLLNELSPDTTYHYRVGSAGDWSGDHTFKTAPTDVCTPFSFGVAADNRSQVSGTSICWEAVYEAIADQGVSFVINTGDMVEAGEEVDQWADFLETSAFLMGEVPLMFTIGNHDDGPGAGDGANYNRIFAMPRNSVNNTEDFYSFDYGNVHFAVLSTQTYTQGDSLYQMQRDWLDQDLAASDKMWKVVYMHRPTYSSGDHGSNEQEQNPVLIPIFDAHHVDLVITGHDHIYERYRPIYNGQEVSSWDDGTCYMVSGGGGAFADSAYPWRPKEDYLEVGDNRNHFVYFSVANNVMTIRAVRVEHDLCMQGGTGAIDEFQIIKTLTEDPCDNPIDYDGDGYFTPDDCDDNDASVNPGAQEVECDQKDNDCNPATADDPNPADTDDDGYSAGCGQDCDDNDSDTHPNALEVCGDAKDNDCDGQTDEGDCENCVDADSDGFNGVGPDCPSGDDCNDSVNTVYPGAPELCNQVDDNCDGATDEDDVCGGDCVDTDGDGHSAQTVDCPTGDDCDDSNAFINPSAQEICGDGIDQDCSGSDLSCTCPDNDSDGFPSVACGGTDCDDNNAAVHPGAAEVCNYLDDDCNGVTDDAPGVKSCGVGPCLNTVAVCADCQPLLPPEDPEATCDDGVDNDCDGWTDGDDGDDCGSDEGCGCGSRTPASGTLPWLLIGMLWLASGRIRRRRN
jgi:hypothetical protein